MQGFVAPGTRPLDHARAIAIGADGTIRSVRLDAKGGFTLSLPTGQSYRVLIANELGTGTLRVVGHLVMRTARGPNAWLAVYDAHPIALGGLHLAGVAAGAGGLHTSDVDLGSDDGDSSDSEGDTEEDDTDHVETCASHDGEDDDDDALEAEQDVNDLADPEHDGDDGEAEDGSPCPPSTSSPPSTPPSSHVPPTTVRRIPWGPPPGPQPK